MINQNYSSETNRVLDALLGIKKTSCKSLPELLKLLKNESIEKKLRLKAYQVFGEMPVEEYLPDFLKVLKDRCSDNDFRSAAAEILGKMKKKEVFFELREILLLENSNFKLRGTIIRILGNAKVAEVADDLLTILQNYSQVFRKLGNSLENQMLLQSMISQELKIIENAFSNLQAKKIVTKLIELSNDKSTAGLIKETVIGCIGEIICQESFTYLEQVLKDPFLRPSERTRAILAIGKLKVSNAIPDLQGIVCDSTVSVQEHRAAIECIFILSDKDCIKNLKELLRNKFFDNNRRKLIAESLGKLQKIDATDDLRLILNDPSESSDLKKSVIKALGKIQTPEALDVLLKALIKESISDRTKLLISKTLTKSNDNELTFKLVSLLNRVCKIKEKFVINQNDTFDQKMEKATKILENISNKSYIAWIQNIIDFVSQRIVQQDIKRLCENLANSSRNDLKVRYAKLLFENVKRRKLPICLNRNKTFSLKDYLSKLFDFVKAENN